MHIVDKIIEIYSNLKEAVKENFSRLLSSGRSKLYLAIFIILNPSLWLYARYIKSVIDEPRIALHYNIDSGVDFYGEAGYIYTIPLTGLLVIVFNILLLTIIIKHKDREFISHILYITAILVNLTLFWALRIVYLVNFR